jgi:hypothetical protein
MRKTEMFKEILVFILLLSTAQDKLYAHRRVYYIRDARIEGCYQMHSLKGNIITEKQF